MRGRLAVFGNGGNREVRRVTSSDLLDAVFFSLPFFFRLPSPPQQRDLSGREEVEVATVCGGYFSPTFFSPLIVLLEMFEVCSELKKLSC